MMGRIKSFSEFGKKLNEDAAASAGEFISQAKADAANRPTPGSTTPSSTKPSTRGRKVLFGGDGKVTGLDLFLATKAGQGLESWFLANQDIERGTPSDSPDTADEIIAHIGRNQHERDRVNRNLEIAREENPSFEAIAPDASLLPPSRPYTYSNLENLTYDRVKDFLVESGEWSKIDKERYTIVALRNKLSLKKRSHNHFIDALVLMSPESDKKVWAYKATTVPGPMFMVQEFRNWYLTHGKGDVINPKGLAIIQPGVYNYKVGTHKGYQAFVQDGNVKVDRYKPVNGPESVDFETFSPGNTESGKFGINIHRASASGTTQNVNTYSAGCLVFANPNDLKEVLKKLKGARQRKVQLAVVQLDDTAS